MTGFASDEIIGMPLSLLDEDVANSGATFHRAMETAKQGGSSALQTQCVRKDRSEFWADVVIGTVRNDSGEFGGFSVVLRDVTARREAEDLLERRSRQLIEASRLKDEFLATVSHELRTPLNSILGWTQLFRAGKLDDDGRAHALETIEQSARTQARLIEDLLDVSRIVTGKMRLDVRSVQMPEVIEAARGDDSSGCRGQEYFDSFGGWSRWIVPYLAIRIDCNRSHGTCCPTRSSSLQPGGGAVHVRLRRAGTSVQLQVKDNGIGIAPDFLPHVFNAFLAGGQFQYQVTQGIGAGLDDRSSTDRVAWRDSQGGQRWRRSRCDV